MPATRSSNARQDVERRRSAWRERLQAELERMLSILRRRPDVHMVHAFGSVGRGAVRYRSDIDLAIVQETAERYVDRLETMCRLLRPRIPTDLVVYTPSEWEAADSDDAFRRRIREEGRVLYAAPRR